MDCNVYMVMYIFTSSSSPFPTRWGQRPEFLISRIFCPGHPLGWSAVPAYPFGRHPSISLLVSPLVFYLALSCQQLLSLRCFLPFSARVHTRVVSFLLLSLVYYSLLAPFWCPHSLLSQCYSFNSSQHPHLCFLENLFLLLSICPTFCSIQKYWSNDSHVGLDH